MVTIKLIKARQIFDSRGDPTVEVEVTCSDGSVHRAAVPSGASTDIYEALELRYGGSDYLGKGVLKVIDDINTIIGPALIGKDPTEQTKIDNFMVQKLEGIVNEWRWFDQKAVDIVNTIIGPVLIGKDPTEQTQIDGSMVQELDETVNKWRWCKQKVVDVVNTIIGPALIGNDPTWQTEIDNFMVQVLNGTTVNEWGWCKQKLGANAILAVSLAVCKAGAAAEEIPLYKHIANLSGNNNIIMPVPAFSMINGGSDAGNNMSIQEFTILPIGACTFKEAMKISIEVYKMPKTEIRKKYGDAKNVSDEGGFAPNIQDNKEGLELLNTVIAKAGYSGKVVIGLDIAASEFYDKKDRTYDLKFKEEVITN